MAPPSSAWPVGSNAPSRPFKGTDPGTLAGLIRTGIHSSAAD
jgi:hypothetical protein